MSSSRTALDTFSDVHRFGFDQWLRLWIRARRGNASGSDDLLSLMNAGLRMQDSGSIGFAPQDLASCETDSQGRDRLLLHFMGLRGASSPLPSFFVDPLQSSRPGVDALGRFLSIFENRMYQLLGLATIRRRPWLREEMSRFDNLGTRLRALAGSRDPHDASQRLGSMGLRSRRRRSVSGLAAYLSTHLGGGQVAVRDRTVTMIGNPDPPRLGEAKLSSGVPLGTRIPVGGERVDVTVGAVHWNVFRRRAIRLDEFKSAVHLLVDDYLPRPMEWIFRFELDLATVPEGAGIRLGGTDSVGQASLGHGAWIGESKTETVVLVGGNGVA